VRGELQLRLFDLLFVVAWLILGAAVGVLSISWCYQDAPLPDERMVVVTLRPPATGMPTVIDFPLAELEGPLTAVPDGVGDLVLPGAPDVSVERAGSVIRVSYGGESPASVLLYEVSGIDVPPGWVHCTAEMRALELVGAACLELWSIRGDEATSSRSQECVVRAGSEWESVGAHMSQGAQSEAFFVGLRLDGPATLELREIQLVGDCFLFTMVSQYGYSGGTQLRGWAPTATIGALCALWGLLCIPVTSRRGGRIGRAAYTAAGLLVIGCAAGMLLVGLIDLLAGATYSRWSPWVLPAALALILAVPSVLTVHAGITSDELKRMAARERSESLH